MRDFLSWCAGVGVPAIGDVQPLHAAIWIERLGRHTAAPTVKLRLAAIRHLFDWLVIGQVVPINPAASVRGPRHVVKSGKTPVLDPAEARALLALRQGGDLRLQLGSYPIDQRQGGGGQKGGAHPMVDPDPAKKEFYHLPLSPPQPHNPFHSALCSRLNIGTGNQISYGQGLWECPKSTDSVQGL